YDGNVKWTKQTPSRVLKIQASSDAVYVISGLDLFRLDTAGNTIWVKNFSAPIYNCTTYKNGFVDMVFDGSRIYLTEMQDTMSNDHHNQYPAILVLDTSGNTIYVNYSIASSGGGIGFQPSVNSLIGGAWIGSF